MANHAFQKKNCFYFAQLLLTANIIILYYHIIFLYCFVATKYHLYNGMIEKKKIRSISNVVFLNVSDEKKVFCLITAYFDLCNDIDLRALIKFGRTNRTSHRLFFGGRLPLITFHWNTFSGKKFFLLIDTFQLWKKKLHVSHSLDSDANSN